MKLLITILLLLINCAVYAQNNKTTEVENGLLPGVQVKDSALARFTITDRLKFYNTPSVSVAVIDGGRVVWAKAYGMADVEHHQPATPATLYQAASMSKTANAILVTRLVQQNRVALDTDIKSYLTGWTLPFADSVTNHVITLRQLLSHTAGINVHGFAGYKRGAVLPTLADILNGTAPANSDAVKAINTAGKNVDYSGGGIMISQKILTDLTGTSYAQLIHKEILAPLKMAASHYAMPLPARLEQIAATGYSGRLKPVEGKYMLYPETAPAGLWTTAADYAKLLIAVQDAEAGQGNGFLSKQSADNLIKPVLDSQTAAPGCFVQKMGTDIYFTHNGHNEGFMCAYYAGVTNGKGVVIMLNSNNYGIIYEILNSVATAYNWQGVYQPQIKAAIAPPYKLFTAYSGDYYCAKLKRTITIRQAQQQLEMHQELEFYKSADSFERIYFTDEQHFFILTSGLGWQFGDNGNVLTFKDGDDVYEAVKVK